MTLCAISYSVILMDWTEYITTDLRARIKQRQNIPVKLTLEALAREYDVSVTPIRFAVKQLISEELLVKGSNSRLKLKHRIGKSVQGQMPMKPADIYDLIAKDLIVQSLRGRPVFLREEAIARRYDIGRSRVRRVFSRLAGEGIIDHIQRRGWRLRPFDQADLDAFLQIREVLELKAIDLAINNLNSNDLKKILSGNLLKRRNYPKADNSLHRYIIERSRNRYIRDFFEHYGKYFEILFAWEDCDRASAILAIRQHRAIIKALLACDRSAAKKAMSDHIRNNHAFLKSINPADIRVTKQRIILKNRRR